MTKEWKWKAESKGRPAPKPLHALTRAHTRPKHTETYDVVLGGEEHKAIVRRWEELRHIIERIETKRFEIGSKGQCLTLRMQRGVNESHDVTPGFDIILHVLLPDASMHHPSPHVLRARTVIAGNVTFSMSPFGRISTYADWPCGNHCTPAYLAFMLELK